MDKKIVKRDLLDNISTRLLIMKKLIVKHQQLHINNKIHQIKNQIEQ